MTDSSDQQPNDKLPGDKLPGDKLPGDKFPGDEVENWTPVRFSLAFVAAMRKEKRLSHRPSVRTAVALPKLLTARWFRLRRLTPQDYLEAAVFNTPYEDQEIADRVACELLFPPRETKRKAPGAEPGGASEAPHVDDAIADILGDLAGAGIDLESLDSLDALLEPGEQQSSAFQAYDLFDELLGSSDPREQSLGQLVILCGGPELLEVHGATTRERVTELIRGLVRSQIGSLTPEHLVHGCRASLGPMLRQLCRQPWELAGALAGAGDHALLQEHLQDLLAHGSTRELGKVLRFLKPFQDAVSPELLESFKQAGVERARELSEFVALLDGLDQWLPPSDELIRRSARANPVRTLQAADWIRRRFEVSLHERILTEWLAGLGRPPTLEELADAAVPCPEWERLLDEAYRRRIDALRQSLENADLGAGLPPLVADSVQLAARIRRLGNTLASLTAGLLATDALCLVGESPTASADVFLSLLDAFIERQAPPTDIDKLLSAAQRLQIDAAEIYDRLGDALDQLQQMVEGNARDSARYQLLSARIPAIPEELTAELAGICHQLGNREGMAVLLAVDLGAASSLDLPADFILGSICFKGIGGGANLLKQWYAHHERIPGELRGRIKLLAKNALIDLALDWMARGGGSAEQGLTPQSRSRPFTAADDLDLLDIENTLDAVIGAGKRLDEMSPDDLFVQDTESGKTAFGVLIDISGSMSAPELSTCAISIVMLLGRLKSEEVAIALFESDTHVVKSFDDQRPLDEVADELLELRASGGTCADRALQWIGDEFAADRAERQVLFLLSDFCFIESPQEIGKHAQRLADQRVRFLGASHGAFMQETLTPLLDAMGGDHLRLTRFERLPAILSEAIQSLGDHQ